MADDITNRPATGGWPVIDREMETRVRTLESKIERHDAKLENGIHSFADIKQDVATRFGELKQDIGKIKSTLEPKAFNWTWLVGFIFTVGVTFTSIVAAFQSRPTGEQVGKMLVEHHDPEVRTLQQENAQLRLQIDRLQNAQQILHDHVAELKARRK